MKARQLGWTLTLLAATLAAPTHPQDKPVSGPLPEPMRSFSFVAGTWVPDSSEARKLREEYTLTPILDGRFLSSEEIFRDPEGSIVYRDFAVYGTDPDTHRLFFHAYNTDGSMDRSRESPDSKPGAWQFLGTVYGSARFRDYRYSMTRVDETHMNVLIELLKDGAYQKYSETRYRRKP